MAQPVNEGRSKHKPRAKRERMKPGLPEGERARHETKRDEKNEEGPKTRNVRKTVATQDILFLYGDSAGFLRAHMLSVVMVSGHRCELFRLALPQSSLEIRRTGAAVSSGLQVLYHTQAERREVVMMLSFSRIADEQKCSEPSVSLAQRSSSQDFMIVESDVVHVTGH